MGIAPARLWDAMVSLARHADDGGVFCGGRAGMGIGAGWYGHEWHAYGHGFPPPGERLVEPELR